MVGHWKRLGGPGATRSIIVNGIGAIATGITVVVVLSAKFVEGALGHRAPHTGIVDCDGLRSQTLSQRLFRDSLRDTT